MKLTLLALSMATLASSAWVQAEPLVIAHRGASGYLPEHTLEAKALAYGMKPDFIEQDVVMTKDDQLVVLHDHYLDRVTDVAERFPDRARGDGRYYAIDFTLAEIKSLRVTEGFNIDDKGNKTAGFPNRFPLWKSDFTVPTLAEEIELIQGLNKTLGYDIGIYPEIKAPWFHRHEGKDISKAVLKMLKEYGYDSQESNVYLQCFDPIELKRINDELLPAMNMDLKLVQLMAYTDWNETMIYDGDQAQPYSYDWMFEANGMKQVATYADGIGPWKPMLVDDASTKENIIIKPLMKAAKTAGLVVHPYTFRAEPDRIAPYADSFDGMLDVFYNTVKVDGLFTDYPDKAVEFLHSTR
ncbi:glycerophosphodiester phosphodiesterase [Vibrio anguillarum]|uniref:glycerophosphodiester phosphodiesterase n=1 Tax=Vibrio anguillarum TaxID=55601 RepID=A0A289GIL0_VIBAN|nr:MULTISPECIES: glycerophosphodiester phosphodiesterase [Vibrio]AQP37672.1 glycerophosphodiester phosphodiesterase [Vibrio anguillarum]ASO30614.1 glycerophosphoryl diester phosphodiesterase [Vibrio anguillarum]ASW83284.1 glycerophosphodiester phosphodiesterase [Vibrio anguillarum]AXN05538.1 glycerophosphodiester phosphodiesterase [Vibrio anguillarum]AZS26539.1 glycerophosphodiester phosphodiesterase [Vibrio anguillarum]